MQRVVLCGASPTRSLPERPRGDGSFLLLPTTCQRAKCCCHPGVPALLFCVVLRTEKYLSFETPGARLADTSFRSHPLDIGGGASQGSSSSSQGKEQSSSSCSFPVEQTRIDRHPRAWHTSDGIEYNDGISRRSGKWRDWLDFPQRGVCGVVSGIPLCTGT